ncbi:hypothetical protein GBAR_LOCUS18376 [Geodia barretti]|uniref:Uncharacterized protein n=1 Tax=Geodia barretti TaxID=519541 RepID=A0AA35SMF5_GEOBA|nr:hypothetical protein GBAR_LOCUS18376 [Geodia barretti]
MVLEKNPTSGPYQDTDPEDPPEEERERDTVGAGGAEVVVEGCPGGSVAQGTGAPLGDMLTKELKDQDGRGFPPQGARATKQRPSTEPARVWEGRLRNNRYPPKRLLAKDGCS